MILKRIGAWLFALSMLLSFASPAAATDVTVHCWCQQSSALTCNHNTQTATVHGTLVDLAANDSQIARDTAFSAENRDTTCNVCRAYCAGLAGGPWRNTNCESGYREEICHTCNAAPGTSCTEANGGRISFATSTADARREELIHQCQSAQTTPVFPVHLGTAIGGVTQVNGLSEYINVAYRYLVSVVLVVAIVMTVYGGFLYLFGASGGNVSAGKDIIRDALIGMLIVLGAYTILATINPATTVLGLNPPQPIQCQDLQLPPSVAHSRCSTDADCGSGSGLRCVEAHNIVFDVRGNLQTFAEGSAAGSAAGHSLAEAINDSSNSFVGDGHADLTGFQPLDALMNSYLQTEAAARDLALTTAGSVVASELAQSADAFFQLRAAANNIHMCSTGEQGSPCTEDRYCRANGNLSCVPGWELCWPRSGNAAGMPCNPAVPDACSGGGLCEAVPGGSFHVCQVVAHDSTPCFHPVGSSSIFPPACGGTDTSSQFVCAFCPSGQHGEARVWSLVGSKQIPGQCKPPGVITHPTDCTR